MSAGERELLNSVVPRIGDVQVLVGSVNCQPDRMPQLSRSGSHGAPGRHQLPGARELLYPVVLSVNGIDVLVGVAINACETVELAVSDTFGPPLGHERPRWTKFLNATVALIGDV